LALESGIQLKEFGIILRIGIQNPRFTKKRLESMPGIRNPGVESGIEDFLDSLT